MAKAKPVMMIVGTECPPEIAKEFSEWYSNKHIPDILKFGKIKKAARFQIISKGISGAKGEGAAQYPQFLATYQYDDWKAVEEYDKWPDRKAILDDWNVNWAPKGAVIKWRIFYEPIKSWGE